MIYTITTIKRISPFNHNKFNKGIKEWSLGKRCIGYFIDLENAKEAVEDNYGDMYEEGHYPYCIIEGHKEGIYGFTSEIYWYKWNSGYKQIDKPKGLENICGYGMG